MEIMSMVIEKSWTLTSDTLDHSDMTYIEELLKSVLEQLPIDLKGSLKEIHLVGNEKTYKEILQSLLNIDGFEEQFFNVYSFEKKEGYSVRGMAFVNEGTVILNLSQIQECAKEYMEHLSSDEHLRNIDNRYYIRDSHYTNFAEYMETTEDCMFFLLWNTLFEQIRKFEQHVNPELDLKEYTHEYDAEDALSNDSIGFSKHVFKTYVVPKWYVK